MKERVITTDYLERLNAMGGYAFPVPGPDPVLGGNQETPGMTLWDYFAAHAPFFEPDEDQTSDVLASRAAEFADAMLAERAKRIG